MRAAAVDGSQGVQPVAPGRVTISGPVTLLDLPGLDRESLEFFLDVILEGGYLARPGVSGNGEAIIFVVVNEALHVLDEVAAWERENEDVP